MRVIVVGAGIVGVTTAWALAEAGCDVTVLERNSGVAQEASYGHAGLATPADAAPWAAPGMPRRVASMLFAQHAAVRIAPTLDPALWRWLGRWLGACRVARHRRNRSSMLRLANYSRDVLGEWRTRHHLAYERIEGLLELVRTPRDAKLAEASIAFLREAGVVHRLLTPAMCRIHEPGLSDIAFEGGIHLPDGETGNCALFARHLRTLCEEAGVRFAFGADALRIGAGRDGPVVRVRDASGEAERSVDAVVIAAGNASGPLLRRLGMRLPLLPVLGFSATIPIREPTFAPNGAVFDRTYDVAIARMGNRIRIAGTAALGERTRSLETRVAKRALATLIKVARDWFPGAASYREASWWVGARPMLPDGPPVLGATAVPGVFVNVGHGGHGWALAAGSARIVADLVMERTVAIDLEGLTLERDRT